MKTVTFGTFGVCLSCVWLSIGCSLVVDDETDGEESSDSESTTDSDDVIDTETTDDTETQPGTATDSDTAVVVDSETAVVVDSETAVVVDSETESDTTTPRTCNDGSLCLAGKTPNCGADALLACRANIWQCVNPANNCQQFTCSTIKGYCTEFCVAPNQIVNVSGCKSGDWCCAPADLCDVTFGGDCVGGINTFCPGTRIKDLPACAGKSPDCCVPFGIDPGL